MEKTTIEIRHEVEMNALRHRYPIDLDSFTDEQVVEIWRQISVGTPLTKSEWTASSNTKQLRD